MSNHRTDQLFKSISCGVIGGFIGFMSGAFMAKSVHDVKYIHKHQVMNFPKVELLTKSGFVENGDSIFSTNIQHAHIVPDSLLNNIQP